MRPVPLSVFAHWPAPNYVNPITRGDALLAVNIVFIILVTLSIAIRLYSKMRFKRQAGIDDIMIVLAYVFTIGMTAVVLLANRSYGWNRHMWDVEVGMIEHANIIAFVAKLMFTFASCFTRMSLIFLYYRLVKDTQFRWYRITLHISLVFNIAILISFVCIATFLCIPVQAYWKFPNVVDGKCMNEGAATLWVGVVSCVADFLCTVLPIPVVLRLRMPLRQRIGVCVLLSAGILVTVAGIVRTWFIYKSLIATYDETWFTYPLWICAALEIDIAVICACVPAMKNVLWPSIRKLTSSLYSNFTSSYRGSKSDDHLTASQDPIVDSGYAGNNGYQLNAMNMGKYPNSGRKVDHNLLEKAIAQLPGANHTRHPHHDPYRLPTETKNHSEEHVQHLLPAVYIPSPHLTINKETTFQVTAADAPRQQSQRRTETNPRDREPYRPRHIPLLPVQQRDNVTPRAWDATYSSRRNAPAGLPPTSLAPKESAIHVTEANAPHQHPERRTETNPRGRDPYRPRHIPFLPIQKQGNVTPRVWDEIYSSRHNAAAGLPPTSPAPERISQNMTAPLSPISPMSPSSMYSSDIDSRISVTPKKKKRHGGTFFLS